MLFTLRMISSPSIDVNRGFTSTLLIRIEKFLSFAGNGNELNFKNIAELSVNVRGRGAAKMSSIESCTVLTPRSSRNKVPFN